MKRTTKLYPDRPRVKCHRCANGTVKPFIRHVEMGRSLNLRKLRIERHFDIRRVFKIPEPKVAVEEKPKAAQAKPAASEGKLFS